MLVWGDQVRIENPEEKLGRVGGALHQLATIPAGIERHSALVAAFIEAGELAQGVADSQLTAAGCDARSAADRAAMALLTKIAAVVRESWTSGFARLGPLPERELRALATSTLPSEICTKRAEGFALYSLYPESYLEAVLAAQLDHAQPTRVVGIRSIGAPLAAMVAAGLDAAPPLTLRPTGELPHRQVAIAEDLAAELLADAGSVRFAVVERALACRVVRWCRCRLPRGSRCGTGTDSLLREPCRAAGAVRASPPSPALGQGEPTCGGPRHLAGA